MSCSTEVSSVQRRVRRQREVLGAIESGVDFEKRIAAIYQKCRTPEQIQFEFDQLQRELDAEIDAGHATRARSCSTTSTRKSSRRSEFRATDYPRTGSTTGSGSSRGICWQPTPDSRHGGYSFMLHTKPFRARAFIPARTGMGKAVEDANAYRIGHPLAQRVLSVARRCRRLPR